VRFARGEVEAVHGIDVVGNGGKGKCGGGLVVGGENSEK
jgi:hypothetical protein